VIRVPWGGMIEGVSVSEILKKRALEIGFDLAGIAPIAIWPDLAFSREWVASGFGGEMRYLSNPKRGDPRLILPSAQSVICVGMVYNAPLPYSTEAGKQSGREAGNREKVTGNRTRDKAEGGRQKTEGAEQELDETRNRNPASRFSTLGRLDANPEFRDSNPETHVPNPEPRAWISRYAWGRDYHQIMREKLERLRAEVGTIAPGTETRVYVDTGAVVERAFARFSGIGWMGKNTCLINEGKGSWFFLGVILSSLALAPDLPAPDRCGSCTRCIEACPTGALVRPYVMDACRCISYLTIENKGSIPTEFRPAIGMNLFGCDICQDVCPWNSPRLSRQPSAFRSQGARRRGAATTSRPEFQPLEFTFGEASHPADLDHSETRGEAEDRSPAPLTPDTWNLTPASVSLFHPPLRALVEMSEEDFRRAFSHSPIKRAKYRGWLRNLCVAMGNSGDASFIPWLERAREHPDAIVREHATWALERLKDAGVRC
jgi:epoxyqueuosine reductase